MIISRHNSLRFIDINIFKLKIWPPRIIKGFKPGMDAIFFKYKNVAPKRSDLFSKPKCRFQNVGSFLKIKMSLPKDRILSKDQQKKIGHFCEMSDIFKWSDLLKWSDILKRSTTISKLKLSSKTLFSYLTGSLLHNWPKIAYKF